MPNQNQPPNFYLKKQSQSQTQRAPDIRQKIWTAGSDPKYSANLQSWPQWWPMLDAWRRQKSRRGIQGFLSSERRPTSPVTSRDFLGQMCWCVQQHQEFFLLWACPVSLWTPVNFLTFTAFCSEKFTLCIVCGQWTKLKNNPNLLLFQIH